MQKSKKTSRFIAFTLIFTMAFTLMFGVMPLQAAKAKKPKLSNKKVTLIVGKSKTLKLKNASKVKGLSWKSKKKSVATVKKKGKLGAKVTAKKKGKAKIVASFKVGKKKRTLTCTVTVNPKKVVTAKPVVTPVKTPTPTPIIKPLPTLRTLIMPNLDPIVIKDSSTFATTKPEAPVSEVTFQADFNNTKAYYDNELKEVYKDDEEVDQNTLDSTKPDKNAKYDGVNYRATGDSNQGGIAIAANGVTGNCLEVTRAGSDAQGALIKLSEMGTVEAGATYLLETQIKLGTDAPQSSQIVCSYQLKTTEESKEIYSNYKEEGQIIKANFTEWQKMSIPIVIPDDMYSYGVYFETWSTGGLTSIFLDDIKLTKISSNIKDKTIPSLYDSYKGIFDFIGVGAYASNILGDNGVEFIQSQFNAITPGNEMKPDALLGSTTTRELIKVADAKALGYTIPDSYTTFEENKVSGEYMVPKLKFETIDLLLKQAKEKGLKVRAHTLVWHEQTPPYFFQKSFKTATGTANNVSPEVMDSRLEFYIRSVMGYVLSGEYGDCVYSWDVVNEYLHSKNGDKPSDSTKSPTYWGTIYGTEDKTVNQGVTLRPSYVKKAFTIAHEELVKYKRTDISLCYNDFNEYEYPENIIYLLDYINEDGVVCNSIGMQAHLTMNQPFHSADRFARAIEMFRLNLPDIEIHVTELDAGKNLDTNGVPIESDQEHASYYDSIMRALIESKMRGGNIKSVTFWSPYDGVSWRENKMPCLFRGLFNPKAPFYAVIDAAKYFVKS